MFHNEDKNSCTIYLYGYSEDPAECDETLEPTIYEIRDYKEMSISEGLGLIKNSMIMLHCLILMKTGRNRYKILRLLENM